MKAEALLRSGGSVAEATNLVNAIRERAYGNNTHNYSTITLKEVQLERRLELAWEGFSRQDDIRFGCFTKGTTRPPEVGSLLGRSHGFHARVPIRCQSISPET